MARSKRGLERAHRPPGHVGREGALVPGRVSYVATECGAAEARSAGGREAAGSIPVTPNDALEEQANGRWHSARNGASPRGPWGFDSLFFHVPGRCWATAMPTRLLRGRTPGYEVRLLLLPSPPSQRLCQSRGCSSVEERHVAIVEVAGSTPVIRSPFSCRRRLVRSGSLVSRTRCSGFESRRRCSSAVLVSGARQSVLVSP